MASNVTLDALDGVERMLTIARGEVAGLRACIEVQKVAMRGLVEAAEQLAQLSIRQDEVLHTLMAQIVIATGGEAAVARP